MTPDEKPELVPVKLHRDVWDRFRRWHRIADGNRAYHNQPHIPLADALSAALSRILDIEDTEYTEYLRYTRDTSAKSIAIPMDTAKLDDVQE